MMRNASSKKKILLSCFILASVMSLIAKRQAVWTQKHGIEIIGGRGSQLAGIMIGTGEWPSFFVIIILLHMLCVLWHGIIPSFVKVHNASHSVEDNHTFFNFLFFTYIFGVARWGHAKKGRM